MVEYDTGDDGWSKPTEEEIEKIAEIARIVEGNFVNTPGRFAREEGFVDVANHNKMTTRSAYTHPDHSNLVVKFAPHEAAWGNKREADVTDGKFEYGNTIDVPEDVLELINPVLEYDRKNDAPRWLVARRLNTKDVSRGDLMHIGKGLRDLGWGVEDLHMNNIGLLNNKPKLIDYEYLKPLEHIPTRIRERIESGEQWK